MCDTARAEKLLSLFASPDSAAAIAGDLTEERELRGAFWFWLHVAGTMLALWRRAVTDAPVVLLLLTVAGCALLVGPAFAGAAAVNWFPHWSDSPVSWIALSLFWWGGALGAGVSLVSIAPRRGMAACAMLAVTVEALLIAFGAAALWYEMPSARSVLFYTIGLATAAPLLAGGAIARRRLIASGIPSLEQHR